MRCSHKFFGLPLHATERGPRCDQAHARPRRDVDSHLRRHRRVRGVLPLARRVQTGGPHGRGHLRPGPVRHRHLPGRVGEEPWRRLYKFRIRRSLATITNEYAPAGTVLPDEAPTGGPVLLRAFCTFHGTRIVVLFAGYDKGRKPSTKQQDRMIAKARRALKRWKTRGRPGYVRKHILVWRETRGVTMALKNFSDLADRAKATWSPAARAVYNATAVSYQAQLAARQDLGTKLATACSRRTSHGSKPGGPTRPWIPSTGSAGVLGLTIDLSPAPAVSR